MIEKHGDLNENSKSDFDLTKKADFFDEAGFEVADSANKNKLNKPVATKPLKIQK